MFDSEDANHKFAAHQAIETSSRRICMFVLISTCRLQAPGPRGRQSTTPAVTTELGQMSSAASSSGVPPAEAGASAGAAEQPPTEGAGAGAAEQPPVVEPEPELFPPLLLPPVPPPPPGEHFPLSFSFKLAVKTRETNFDTHVVLDNTWFIEEKTAKRMGTT